MSDTRTREIPERAFHLTDSIDGEIEDFIWVAVEDVETMERAVLWANHWLGPDFAPEGVFEATSPPRQERLQPSDPDDCEAQWVVCGDDDGMAFWILELTQRSTDG